MPSEWLPDLDPTELPDGTWEFAEGAESHSDEYEPLDDLEESDCDDDFRPALERPNRQTFDDNSSRIMRATQGIPPIYTFTPPTSADTPETLFEMGERIVRRSNPHEILIYTDGASLGNGTAEAKAGCGFVCGSGFKCDFRLEEVGPTGEPHQQTSNRAELRAVIGALESRAWAGDSWGQWDRIVIATDSSYVVSGITDWVHTWTTRGWVTSKGSPVKNQDLWERLLKQIAKLDQIPLPFLGRSSGVAVSFWKIPRAWNAKADSEARRAAGLDEVHKYMKIICLPDLRS
ncbi:hypothetical protein ACMFMG_010320 [Clarireedia jacksonii]